MRKRKSYKVDPGYMTCPDAARLFLDIVGKTENEYREYYEFFLEGAKQGKFSGKEYKTNMYQVKKSEIVAYAKSYQETDFCVDLTKTLDITDREVNTQVELNKNEINTIIAFQEQGILKKEAAYDAIKKIILN
ncbi:hypothetical protein LGQ02_09800 [Bacillus shivajii]|uniref:hypothetical protein n=1 Tax=Bacillus shivajii TaxID=1983719 RepID=UPI001CFB8C05|nr:hypothetical protein [Bacillus shivajii]UCZ54988.1 hypothetical protein LGQ02_09800 [Bacillus shivajii]